VPRAKKKKKAARKPAACGKCGKTGHNARRCEQADEASPAPEVKAPPSEEAREAADVAPTPAPAPTVEPKAKPKPKPKPKAKATKPPKQTKAQKEEGAFWNAVETKMAPDAVASASELTQDIPRISTGNFTLDMISFGGLPQGRIIRFWGQPKSGKTGACLNAAATFQKEHCSECFQKTCSCKNRGVPMVLWVDAEHRMADMMSWAAAHGINLDRFKILCPPTGQHVVDLVDAVLRSPKVAKVGLIVIDSLAHIVSQDELKKATRDGPTVGRNAALLNSAFRKWVSAIHALGIRNKRKPTILAINQLREKVGVVYGSPHTMPGGKGQAFATSLDVQFQSGSACYVVFNEKKQEWTVKVKGYKSNFKPGPEMTPDFIQVTARCTDSGICPRGRYGVFNYWLSHKHKHRPGDPDNPLQLWQYARKYMVEVAGQTKSLAGLSASTYDKLEEEFRKPEHADKHQLVWDALMLKLCHEGEGNTEDGVEEESEQDVLENLI